MLAVAHRGVWNGAVRAFARSGGLRAAALCACSLWIADATTSAAPISAPSSGRATTTRAAAALSTSSPSTSARAASALARGEFDAELARISTDRIEQAIAYLASPELEGRDSPSRGLELAARYVARRFAEAGLAPSPDSTEAWKRLESKEIPAWARVGEGVWLRPYRTELGGREGLRRPKPDGCDLDVEIGDEAHRFAFGVDFVPVPGCDGDVRGELIFGGFGIRSRKERYDDFRGNDVAGKIVMILDGEPRHKKRFDGEEVSEEASLWSKLETLRDERAVGALVVRRPPPGAEPDEAGAADADAPPPLGYRYTVARWQGVPPDRRSGDLLPALEISPACASLLLDTDVLDLAKKIDRSAKPITRKVKAVEVSMRATSERAPAELFNLLAWIPGGDLAEEVVVVGAHYDHIGVGPRGRIGHGADDNASGTAALCEIANALAGTRPRRSILLAAFSAEEDGLLGSKALARDLPVSASRIAAMVNLDMIGRGETNEVVVLGVDQNPGMRAVLKDAQRLGRTGIKKIRECPDKGLFQRSDHYSFHEVGIPTVFFFENYPLERNEDYHTWRDLPARVDLDKVTSTARLATATTWILANEDERLPSPR